MTSQKDFEILKKIGAGSFGEVFLVRRNEDQKLYALKQIQLDKLTQQEQQFALNEVRILASIKHPNIISYKDTFIDSERRTLSIVLEHANLGDLQAMIQLFKSTLFKQESDITFSENEIWECAIQILQGLDALHKSRICHRDVKSSNIFVHKEKSKKIYKLGDLNVAKVQKQQFMTTLTGTPFYSSPEVLSNIPYDLNSDIWSLGCIIYEMATLDFPFHAESMEELCQKIIFTKPRRIPFQYSDDLWAIVSQCLTTDPNQRPSTFELLNDMQMRYEKLGFMRENNENRPSLGLINTITMPSNLSQLKKKLPSSNYENERIIVSHPIRLRNQNKASTAQPNSMKNKVNRREAILMNHLSPNYQLIKNLQAKKNNQPSIFQLQKQDRERFEPSSPDFRVILLR